MHISLPIDGSIEFINVTEINPLISKCEIKVCAVSDEPNRNGSVMTKTFATDLAQSLPGSPIVGFYNENKGDYESHNKTIEISGSDYTIKDNTFPYGFIDLNANIWFQKFLDDDEVIREYLLTEGYLWTGQYPESQRVIDKGNNQSMELDDNSVEGFWSKNVNNDYEFFIFNEAIISKLCILGEDVEPCFQGSQIKLSFSNDFQDNLFSLLKNMKEKLHEGGKEFMAKIKSSQDETMAIEFSLENKDKDGNVIEDKDVKKDFDLDPESNPEPEQNTDPTPEGDPEVNPVQDKDANPEEDPESTNINNLDENSGQDNLFNLEENSIYLELKNKFEKLSNDYDSLQTTYNNLKSNYDILFDFKEQVDLKEKQEMINSFSMLSDEDKKDVLDNIKTYSLSDIESKLSVILVRNQKINEKDNSDTKDVSTVFNIAGIGEENSGPGWINAAREKQKSF